MTDERKYETGQPDRPDDRTGGASSERRGEDRRHVERGTMTEPAPNRSEPMESQRTSRQMDYWPEMTQYRQRFDEIQAQFIQEPREAVKKAEQLVEEAVDKMSNSMREKIRSMHQDAESGDTERLRLTMKTLRDFIESMGGARAA